MEEAAHRRHSLAGDLMELHLEQCHRLIRGELADLAYYGLPLYTSMKNSTAVVYGGVLQPLTERFRHVVRDADPNDDIVTAAFFTKKFIVYFVVGHMCKLHVSSSPASCSGRKCFGA
ncbi:hypothetical protein AAG570_001793 [Ranatra chinensis]|uniref:Uncharacterized protein n=1 Tax=Ranatra chinensis TaxID=642074 RepID=A0ABD0Y9I8_9HEMI